MCAHPMLWDRLEVYARVENLTGKHYETEYQYGTLGRSAYAGCAPLSGRAALGDLEAAPESPSAGPEPVKGNLLQHQGDVAKLQG